MQILQNAFIPALLAGVGLYALYKGVDVFPTFLRGAKNGLKTAWGLIQALVKVTILCNQKKIMT